MATEMERDLFINRELSWLEFNSRVLELSREKYVPLGEQLKFAAIYGSNLDEFFMIRVGSLYDQTLLKLDKKENKTGMTPKQQLASIMPKVRDLQHRCDKNVQRLYGKLAAFNLHKVDFEMAGEKQKNFWKKYFLQELFPVLSPQIIDRRHPFPFLRNQELYVGALLQEGKSGKPVFGLLPVSNQYERIASISDGEMTEFVLVEELLLQFASLAFGKAILQEACLFRVTRNADLEMEEGMFDHDLDYRVIMGEVLKKRRKLAAVRLQFFGIPSAELKGFLQEKLLLPEEQCFDQKTPLNLQFLFTLSTKLEKLEQPDLFYPLRRPLLPPMGFRLYTEVQQRDVLLCYPYESIRPFVQMLHEAACDPTVLSIKMTLYRVATDSKIIEALIEAAENGKEVVTIVELRARFDEQNNIDWSRQLEQAGCTVIYGFSDYKVHSKVTLITRKTQDGFHYISQIGTGNYNEKTSELYTDLSFITSNKRLGEEVGNLFNRLATEQITERVEQLIVAPLQFKTVLLQEMTTEMEYRRQGGDTEIVLKCNSISDRQIIETLSEASQSGVPVRMVVRGICCLRAGVVGVSENIQLRSIVGRYLEHSRIYAFGKGERMRIYIASGDFLTRNTERRVEVGVKIEDSAIRKILCDILEMQWADTLNARQMQPDGRYAKIPSEKGKPLLDSQMAMYPYLEGLVKRGGANAKARPMAEAIEQPRVQKAGYTPVAYTHPKSLLGRVKRWLRRR